MTITGCAVILVIDPTEQAQHAPLARVAAEKGIAVAADVTEALRAAHEWLATPAPAPAESISDGAAHPGAPAWRSKSPATWPPAASAHCSWTPIPMAEWWRRPSGCSTRPRV